MTIHRQTLTLTVYSINPVDSTVLADNFKEAIRHHGAVVDVEQESAAILTTDAGQLELWHKGFDPDVLDGYNQAWYDDWKYQIADQAWYDDWKYQIANDDTKLGYHDWLEHQTEYLSYEQF